MNRLQYETSPYLRQHAENPVDWYPWGDEAFETAALKNRPVLLSVGYSTCHWCHVMQQESYQDDEIAAMLNKRFVSVKIDRELQPALDAWLIEFTETTEGTAGWPLNVFLTPDGYPLIGATYLPRDDFQTLLRKLTAFWKSDRDRAIAFSRDIVERIRASKTASPAVRLPDNRQLRTRLIEQALSLGDELQVNDANSARVDSLFQRRQDLACRFKILKANPFRCPESQGSSRRSSCAKTMRGYIRHPMVALLRR